MDIYSNHPQARRPDSTSSTTSSAHSDATVANTTQRKTRELNAPIRPIQVKCAEAKTSMLETIRREMEVVLRSTMPSELNEAIVRIKKLRQLYCKPGGLDERAVVDVLKEVLETKTASRRKTTDCFKLLNEIFPGQFNDAELKRLLSRRDQRAALSTPVVQESREQVIKRIFPDSFIQENSHLFESIDTISTGLTGKEGDCIQIIERLLYWKDPNLVGNAGIDSACEIFCLLEPELRSRLLHAGRFEAWGRQFSMSKNKEMLAATLREMATGALKTKNIDQLLDVLRRSPVDLLPTVLEELATGAQRNVLKELLNIANEKNNDILKAKGKLCREISETIDKVLNTNANNVAKILPLFNKLPEKYQTQGAKALFNALLNEKKELQPFIFKNIEPENVQSYPRVCAEVLKEIETELVKCDQKPAAITSTFNSIRELDKILFPESDKVGSQNLFDLVIQALHTVPLKDETLRAFIDLLHDRYPKSLRFFCNYAVKFAMSGQDDIYPGSFTSENGIIAMRAEPSRILKIREILFDVLIKNDKWPGEPYLLPGVGLQFCKQMGLTSDNLLDMLPNVSPAGRHDLEKTLLDLKFDEIKLIEIKKAEKSIIKSSGGPADSVSSLKQIGKIADTIRALPHKPVAKKWVLQNTAKRVVPYLLSNPSEIEDVIKSLAKPANALCHRLIAAIIEEIAGYSSEKECVKLCTKAIVTLCNMKSLDPGALREIGLAIPKLAEWLDKNRNANAEAILEKLHPDMKPTKKMFHFMAGLVCAGVSKVGSYGADAAGLAEYIELAASRFDPIVRDEILAMLPEKD